MAKTNNFAEEALIEARLAAKNDEIPVGAVVVYKNKIIARAHNQSRNSCDATAHAEILAIRKACEVMKTHRLDDCDLYVTLEPCFMCLGAILLARIRRVFYGQNDSKFGAVESLAHIFQKEASYQKPEIYSQLSALDSQELMTNFFKKLR